uniref:Uncharacterized protein n=1 Tax=Anopheles coluzzii TaxID=1518534 RepID=A0A8W7PUG5_ANOCL
MWGVKLWAPFQPHASLDWAQKFSSCCRNGPVGQAYRMYSRGAHSSRKGSFTCASSQSEASWTPRLPLSPLSSIVGLYAVVGLPADVMPDASEASDLSSAGGPSLQASDGNRRNRAARYLGWLMPYTIGL